ncbi:MAG: hypothetical protein V4592_15500 [Bacteroidota bacterium]
MKTIYLIITSLLVCSVSLAQETIERVSKLKKNVTENYHVLLNNPNVKHGLYQVRFEKNKALASGLYANNKRVGIWHFFDYKGNLMQNYNYDQNQLTFEAPDEPRSGFKYLFDKPVVSTDVVTKPVKIGGRYYGYLNYLLIFKKPSDIGYIDSQYTNATIELLISPGGHLADYTIHLIGDNYRNDLSVNIDLLSDEDKTFIPATLNGDPVSARIVIPCVMDRSGNLVF